MKARDTSGMTHTTMVLPYSVVRAIVQKAVGFTENNGYDCIEIFWGLTKNKKIDELELLQKAVATDPTLKLWLESFKGRKLNKGNIWIDCSELGTFPNTNNHSVRPAPNLPTKW